MKRAFLFCFALTACDFEGAYRARCDAGKFKDTCPELLSGGGMGGAGGGIGPIGGGPPTDPRMYSCLPNYTTAMRSGFGEGAWTFENPNSNQANDLFAVWGGSKPDGGTVVWFAGAGPTLGRLDVDDNVATDERWRLPPLTSGQFEVPPAITSVVTTQNATYLLAGRRVLEFTCGDDTFHFVDAGIAPVQAIAGHRNKLYALHATTNSINTLESAQAAFTGALLGEVSVAHSLYIDDDWCLVSGRYATGLPLLFDCRNDRAFPIGTERAFAIRKLISGVIAVASDRKILLPLTDGGIEVQNLPMIPTSHTWADFMTVNSDSIMITDSAEQANVVTGFRGDDFPAGALSSWSVPSGRAFVVGSHGSVVDDVGGALRPTVFHEVQPIRGLFVEANFQVAVGPGRTLFRSNFSWAESLMETHSWTSVAATSDGYFWFTAEDGKVYGRASPEPNPNMKFQGPPRAQAYDPRSAASIRGADGGVIIGVGSIVGRGDGQGNFTVAYDVRDAGLGVDRIVALAEGNDSMLYLVVQDINQYSNLLMESDAGWTTPVGNTTPLRDISLCPDGTFVVCGINGMLGRLNNQRMLGALVTPAPPTNIEFSSIWCDQNNGAWAVTGDGLVMHFPDANTTIVERTGWGRRSDRTIEPSYIRGTVMPDGGTMIFISGGSGAILSRAVP